MKAQACKSANIYFSLKRYHLSSFLQMCLQVIHSLTFSGRIFIDLRFYISRCISQRWSFSSFKLKTGLFYSYPFLFIQICSLEINFFTAALLKYFSFAMQFSFLISGQAYILWVLFCTDALTKKFFTFLFLQIRHLLSVFSKILEIMLTLLPMAQLELPDNKLLF